jgi:hypothetical protein
MRRSDRGPETVVEDSIAHAPGSSDCSYRYGGIPRGDPFCPKEAEREVRRLVETWDGMNRPQCFESPVKWHMPKAAVRVREMGPANLKRKGRGRPHVKVRPHTSRPSILTVSPSHCTTVSRAVNMEDQSEVVGLAVSTTTLRWCCGDPCCHSSSLSLYFRSCRRYGAKYAM